MTEKKPAFIATLLTGFAAFCAAQSKPAAKVACAQVKIVVADNAATPTTSAVRFDEFGRTCTTGTPAKAQERPPTHSPVCELLGPNVTEVLVEHYPARLGTNPQVVAHLRRVLQSVSQDSLESYIAWSEGTLPGITAKVRFRDGYSTVLEESSGHICFVDRDHNVWLTRLLR